MRKIFVTVLLNFVCFIASASDTTFTETAITVDTYKGELKGTITIPNVPNAPIALIIAGSGPTDRNGNNIQMRSDNLKLLAQALAAKGISSLRFDKRGIAESAPAAIPEQDLRFSNSVEDAKAWLNELKKDKRFSRVGIIGHSEGSLIGLAVGNSADFFVSIAGAGRNIGEVLKEQISAQPPFVKEAALPLLDSMIAGHTVATINPMLVSLFRPSVQPYLISLIQQEPTQLIQKMNIPILIVQGTNDIQVSVKDAELLSAANKKAKLKLITNMNHMFRIIEGDRMANIQSYGKYELPISSELVEAVSDFIVRR